MKTFKLVIKLNKEFLILNVLLYSICFFIQSFDNLDYDVNLNYILLINLSAVFLDLTSNFAIKEQEETNKLSKQLKILIPLICYISYFNFYHNFNAHKYESGLFSNQTIYKLYKNKLYNINSIDEIRNNAFIKNIHTIPNLADVLQKSSCSAIKNICKSYCKDTLDTEACTMLKLSLTTKSNSLSCLTKEEGHPCL